MRSLTLALAPTFALALTLACPALAETDVRQTVIEVARASNCMINDEIAEAAFPAMGLTKEDVGPVVQEMVLAGEGEVIDNAFQLSAALCAGEAGTVAEAEGQAQVTLPVSPLMGRVIEVFRANGCAMTEDFGMPALLAAGITETELDSLEGETETLMEAGLMTIDDTGITVSEPLCSNPVITDEPSQPLIDMLADNGCALSQEAAAALVGGYGMTMEMADEMADDLMDRGLARIEGDNLVLSDCGD